MLNNKQSGMSLIELLISMALGLLLLGAASSMALSSLFSNKDSLRNLALEQESQPIISLVARELRRSGASRDGEDDSTVPSKYFRKINMPGATVSGTRVYTGSCIIYRYDRNKDNILTSDEVSGFGIQNGQLLMLSSPSNLAINTCDFTDTHWKAINSIERINISNFTLVASTETVSGSDLINTIKITLTGTSSGSAFSSTLTDTVQLRNLPKVN